MSGRAGADDGDLLGIGLAGLVQHGRDEPGLGVQIVVGDKALDLVDGNSLIQGAAGALGLADVVADSAADGGEGILLLDQLQGLGITTLGSQTQIALDGDMGRQAVLQGAVPVATVSSRFSR